MTSTDTLLRFLFEHAAIRGEIVHLDATWRCVTERHTYPPTVRLLLGEMMAAAALLSATLKYKGSLIMQVQGSGPVPLLVVEATSERTLRGMAQWSGETGGLPFQRLVGQGRFVITIDPRESGQRYQGIVDLDGDSLSDVLENYLKRSEQLESRLWLAADDNRAAGMLLQKMPEGQSDDADLWERAAILGSTLKPDELLGLPAGEIIRRLYHEEDLRVFEKEPWHFQCSCSKERVVNVLRMLGYNEVRSILEERGCVDVDCEFCNKHYRFDKVDAEQLFAAEIASSISPTRH